MKVRDDLTGWVREGPVVVEPGADGTVLSSSADEAVAGDGAHWTLWRPVPVGADVRVSVGFTPLTDEGLAMVFIGAAGVDGQDLFDPALAPRTGRYPQYHSSDLRALHVSFYRRKWPTERRFHTCNLRKAPGFHLVAQGADPLPAPADADGPYRVELLKRGPHLRFSIDGVVLLDWTDDARNGPVVGAGHLGFRQMAPLRARWTDLVVEELPDVRT